MCRCLFVSLIVLGLGTGAASAQRDSTAGPRVSNIRGVWASGAVGFADDQFFDTFGLHVQRGRAVMSVRKDAVGVGGTGPTNAVGVLFGVATTSVARWHIATSLGVARSTRIAYSIAARGYERETATGAIVAADLALRAGRSGGAGLGLAMAASRNAVRSYAAIGLEVSLGRWR